jgi:hypothetical protein
MFENSGCADFRAAQVRTGSPYLDLALPSGRPEYVAVRVGNTSPNTLYVDWAGTHVRWPSGFEGPVDVAPHRALSTVYSGGAVEYHVFPVHYYLAPDAFGARRNSLAASLVPRPLWRQYFDRYTLTLLVPICEGDAVSCKCHRRGEGGTCEGWDVTTSTVVIEEVP